MLFSSIPFLYTFLPCVLILYFLVPGWLKNTVLLLSSLFFYAWGEPRFVVFMVIAIVQGYVFGLLAEKFRDRPKRAKLCLWASAVVSLGLLGYCKYADFFISGFKALWHRAPNMDTLVALGSTAAFMWPCPSASAFTPFRS